MRREKNGKIRVLVCDPHPSVHDGLRAVMKSQPDMELCGAYVLPSDCLEQAKRLSPDVIICALVGFKAVNGFELLKELSARFPRIAVVVLTRLSNRFVAERAFGVGAKAFVVKTEPVQAIMDAIRAAFNDSIYICRSLAAEIVGAIVLGKRALSFTASLRPREREVLHEFAKGKGVSELAQFFRRSVKTVDSHLDNIRKKFGLKNRVELLELVAGETFI